MAASDYEIEAVLDEGRSRRVLRARRRHDGLAVVVKQLRPGAANLAPRVRREYTMLRRICATEVVRALALDDWHGLPALVLALVDGTPLSAWIRRPHGAADLVERLRLALGLTRAVAAVHAAEVLHRDIKPSNVLVTPDSRVVLIDFSAATLTRDGDARDGEGTLQYMAPEQTGRTGRVVDTRSDHYALGVTLYELFTGRLPFQDDDPLGLVHSHLARVPPPPQQFCPELPVALAQVILKLLEKSPDARYQSMRGLRSDLQHCLDELCERGRIDPFTPGLADVSPQLRLPEHLFGRDAQRDVLELALARARAGEPGLVIVAGPAGAGKSALVRSLITPAAAAGATVARGNFDPSQRDIPHAALAGAIEQLVRRRLAEPEASLIAWKARLSVALGPVAGLVCDLVPALGAVLGRQPPVPDMPPAEAARRFEALLLRLFRALAPEGRPLLLVLDDLQWADEPALRVVELLLHGELPHLLIVGCVREDAPGDPSVTISMSMSSSSTAMTMSSLPLIRLRTALTELGRPPVQLHLAPLTLPDTAALVAATLAWSIEQAAPLARFIHARSDGNPLFVRSLLRWLHEQRLLRFDGEAGAWHWDAGQAASAGVDEDLGALLTRKLAELTPAARAALEFAACVGNRFTAARISAVLGDSRDDTDAALAEASARGLVQRVQHLADDDTDADNEPSFEFAHERVQQAAYALAEPQRRVHLHLRLGRSLLADDPTGASEMLFAITGHLNLASALIDDPREQLQLAELNLVAARRARQATAHAVAAQHVAHGCALLPDDAWTTHYPLCFALHCERMECEHLAGDMAAALARFEPLLHNARDDLDRGEIHDLKVRLDVTRECYIEATRTGIAGLRLLGVDLHECASQASVLRELAGVRWQRGLRSFAALANLPEVRDPRIRLALRLLARINIPAYYVDEPTLAAVALRGVALSIRHGVSNESAVGFAVYAAIAFNRLEDPAAARDLWAVARALGERFPSPALAVRMATFGGIFVEAWVQPFIVATTHIASQIEPALALGDTTLASMLMGAHIDLQWLGASTLAQIERTVASVRPVARRLAGFDHSHWFVPIERACLALRGRTESLSSMSSSDWQEHAFVDQLRPERVAPTFFYAIHKAALLVHAGRFREAELIALEYHRVRMEGAPLLVELLLLRVLARTAQTPGRPLTPGDRTHLHRWLRRMQLWVRACPENFAPRALLAEAELARAEGQRDPATLLYMRAAAAARAQGQLRVEALALERCGRHLLTGETPGLSDMYLRSAREAYARWGADAIVAALDAEFPRLSAPGDPTPPIQAVRETTTTNPGALDVEALLRASQAISGEIELEPLLRTLVRIVQESAGARRCAVLLARGDGELRVEALAELESVQVLQGLALADARLPASVVHLAARSRRDVILDDAAVSEFAGDPAVAGLRSVLCTPILHHSALLGVLYLDNELAPGIFTADRIALLRQLAGQVAISVENARLYRGLAQARDAAVAADRTKTRFLMNMSHELRTPLNAVLGYTELIQESAADGDTTALHTDLDKIRRAANRLLQTLGSILELSRVEAGDLRPAPEPIDLEALVREVVDESASHAAAQDNQIQVDIAADLPPLASDRGMLLHAVRSLLDNALRFTAGGRVELAARGYLSEGSAWIAVRVQDTGIGIASADLPRLFTSFGQLDDAPTRNFEGTGVSLALTRRFCALLGGRVEVESEPGTGSSFTLHLPASAPA